MARFYGRLKNVDLYMTFFYLLRTFKEQGYIKSEIIQSINLETSGI